MRTVWRPSKALSAGTTPELVFEAEQVVVERIDQIEIDGIFDDGVADLVDPLHMGLDVGAHGILLGIAEYEPIVRRCLASSGGRRPSTNCSPVPGRAMRWWGRTPPR